LMTIDELSSSTGGSGSLTPVFKRMQDLEHCSLYPPDSRRKHTSLYGQVLNNGVNDPFDYGLPSLRERPSSPAFPCR
jgi:hypothetical protein